MKREIFVLAITMCFLYAVSAQADGDAWELYDKIDALEPEIDAVLEDAGIDTTGFYAQLEDIEILLGELERLWEEERWDEADRLEMELMQREKLILDAMTTAMGARRMIAAGEIPKEKREMVFEMGNALGRGDFQTVLNIKEELKGQLESPRPGIEVPKREPEDGVPKKEAGINWEAIGVVLIVIGGGTGWYLQRKKRGHVARYMDEIDNVYSSYKMKTRRCEAELYRIKDMIVEDFKRGKLDDNSFAILDKRIDDYFKDVREQIMNERFGGLPSQLKGELSKMLKDGTIKEEEFATFERILEKTAGLKDEEKRDLKDMLKTWKEKDKDGP